MLQIHILDRCEFCDGQAYVYVCEFTDENGESYPRYIPCAYCKGSGELDKWVTLDLLFKGYVSKSAIHPDKQPRLCDFIGAFACQEGRFR